MIAWLTQTAPLARFRTLDVVAPEERVLWELINQHEKNFDGSVAKEEAGGPWWIFHIFCEKVWRFFSGVFFSSGGNMFSSVWLVGFWFHMVLGFPFYK